MRYRQWNGCVHSCALILVFDLFVANHGSKRAHMSMESHPQLQVSVATRTYAELRQAKRLDHREPYACAPPTPQSSAASSSCSPFQTQVSGVHASLEFNIIFLCVDACSCPLPLSYVQDGGKPQQPVDTGNAAQRTRVAGRSSKGGGRRRRTG